jgi:succinate dehydrogenase / fumarate reductase, cytochrome b subunit
VTTKRERPLSPHLQVYRFQITMTMSILHRITGVVLAIGSLLLVCWLLAVASGGDQYERFHAFATSPLGWVAWFGLSFCLVYHLLNGIRHLLWDVGVGIDIPGVYAGGWTVAVLAALGTAALWFAALAAGGLA